jgi:hypothetical protein
MMYHTAEPRITFDEEPDARTLRGLKGDNGARYTELKKRLAEFDSLKPAPQPLGQFMIDIGPTAPPTYTLKNGNVQAKGEEVRPGFLSGLDPSDARITAGGTQLHRPARRLAAWLADPKNP